jgi:hypothetical protein
MANTADAAHAKYEITAEGDKRQRVLAVNNALNPNASAKKDNHHDPRAGGKRSMTSGGADVINSELSINGQATAFRTPAIPSQPRRIARIVALTGLRFVSSFMRSNAAREPRAKAKGFCESSPRSGRAPRACWAAVLMRKACDCSYAQQTPLLRAIQFGRVSSVRCPY